MFCSPSVRYQQGMGKTSKKQRVVASYYGHKFHGKKTANGEIFDMYDLTAAHKTFPFGTELEVTNPISNQSVVVRINDRGPFIRGRELDLSFQAAKKIGLIRDGFGDVYIKIIKLGTD